MGLFFYSRVFGSYLKADKNVFLIRKKLECFGDLPKVNKAL